MNKLVNQADRVCRNTAGNTIPPELNKAFEQYAKEYFELKRQHENKENKSRIEELERQLQELKGESK